MLARDFFLHHKKKVITGSILERLYTRNVLTLSVLRLFHENGYNAEISGFFAEKDIKLWRQPPNDVISVVCVLNTNQIQEQYLRNLNDCPCCRRHGRSLRSPPAPASYGLHMKKELSHLQKN